MIQSRAPVRSTQANAVANITVDLMLEAVQKEYNPPYEINRNYLKLFEELQELAFRDRTDLLGDFHIMSLLMQEIVVGPHHLLETDMSQLINNQPSRAAAILLDFHKRAQVVL